MVDNSYNKGYIALITAIILSALLMIISASVATGGYFSRFNVLYSEFKLQSTELAQGCLSYALVGFALNPNFSNPGNLNIEGYDCKIVSVQYNYPASGETTFQTSASYQGSVTVMTTIINNTSLVLISSTQK
jgi:hypothetical protein